MTQIKRWTDEMVLELKQLRYENRMTLKELGNKYGVSRERIRQVLGNSYYVNHKPKKLRANQSSKNSKYENMQIVRQRFLNLIEKDDETDCWNWKGAIGSNDGYSRWNYKMSPRKYAHYLEFGELLDKKRRGWITRYKCGNNKCVNPNHEKR